MTLPERLSAMLGSSAGKPNAGAGRSGAVKRRTCGVIWLGERVCITSLFTVLRDATRSQGDVSFLRHIVFCFLFCFCAFVLANAYVRLVRPELEICSTWGKGTAAIGLD